MKSLSSLWKTSDKPDIYLIAFLLIFTTVSLFLLNAPATTDEGTHSLISLFFRDLIRDWVNNPTLSFSKIYDYAISYLVHYPKLSLYYPPLLHVIVSFFYSLFGPSFFVARIVVLLFSVGMLVMLYKTVKILLNGKTALLVTCLASVMPMVYYNSITVMTDIPYMFFFMLAMYFYIKAFDSNKKVHFIIASVATALGFLTKWNAILILPIIFAYAFLEKRDQMKNVVLSIILVFLIISPYMFVIWKTGLISIPFISSLQVSATAKHDPQFDTVEGWMYYPKVLANQYFTIPIFLASIAALIYYSLRKERYWKLLVIWSLVFYLFFTVLSNKEPRYVIPMIPALLLPLSFFIVSQRYRISVPIIIFISILLLFSTSQLISSAFYYNPDISGVVKQTLDSDGNVLVAAESGWFYSSQFIFKLASMDESASKFVYRPCSLSAMSLSELSSIHGIRYVILPEPVDRDLDKVAIVKSSSILNTEKVFSTSTTNITLYTSNDYVPQKEYCNFVCVLNTTVCSKYELPRDALK